VDRGFWGVGSQKSYPLLNPLHPTTAPYPILQEYSVPCIKVPNVVHYIDTCDIGNAEVRYCRDPYRISIPALGQR
jgi:hypothetical protein